jgi:hypothetical protein
MLDRRFESNLPSFRGFLRASAANQSFVAFHSFRFCTKSLSCRHPLVWSFTPQNQITTIAGGR